MFFFFLHFVGIQQWRLDSDVNSPAFLRKDEVDSIQSCLNAVPKMKVLIIGGPTCILLLGRYSPSLHKILQLHLFSAGTEDKIPS